MRMKRFLAGFLCLCMVGTMDMPYVQAASVAAKSEPIAQESVKQDTEDTKPGEDVENQDNDKQDAEQSETTQSAEAAEQKEVVKDTGAAEQKEDAEEAESAEQAESAEEAENAEQTESAEEVENTGSTENEAEQTALLNYALIDQPTVEMPGTQNVLLSIGDENTVIESAVLDYVNETTGKAYQAQAATISQDAVLFTMEFPEGSEAGAYRLVGVTYQINGTEQTLLFQDAGMDMRFGVNTTVETNPDSVVVEESSADVDVVTMDENGNTESADSIGDAIRNAQSETPATNSMDDVAAMGASKNVVVVLDPGHDDTHAGARRNGLEEEDLTLKIAQYCKAELSQYSGVTVYMTRESGACANGGGAVTSVECNAKRVEYAQKVGANVYVSMHINAGGGNGAEIFYPNQNYRSDLGTTGHDLAQQILNKILELGIGEHGQGLKIHNSEDNTLYPDGSLADYLGVIRRSKLAGIPAILIEHAYIDTSDANYLNSDEKLKKFGVADAIGIANYYGLTKNTATPVITSIRPKGANVLKINWRAGNAKGYEVYRSTRQDGGYKKVATVTGKTYSDKNRIEGKTYYYKVRSVLATNRYSKYSTVKTGVPLGKVKALYVQSRTSGGVTVKWEKAAGATKYIVTRKQSGAASYQQIGTTGDKDYFVDTTAAAGVKYSYKIKPVNTSGYGGYGNAVSGVSMKKPTINYVKSVKKGQIKIAWKSVAGAGYYQVYRSTSKNGTYKKIKETKSLSYTDKNRTEGKAYYYKIRAVKKVADKAYSYSNYSSKKSTRNLKTPAISSMTSYTSNKLKIKWNKVKGADYYQLYRSTSKSGTYKYVATVKGREYIDSSLKAGKKYYYKVRAVNKTGSVKGYSSYSKVVSGSTLQVASINKAYSYTSSQIKLQIKTIKGASGYQIYRSTSKNGSYKKVAETSSATYLDKKLSGRKTYYYKVRAVKKQKSGTGYGSFSGIKSCRALKKSGIISIRSTSSTKLEIRWNPVNGANRYELYRSTSKNGTYKKIKTTTATSYIDTNRTEGKTYYYKVRAYNLSGTAGGKNSMSGIQTGKTLKKVQGAMAVVEGDKALVRWCGVSGAAKYQIKRSTARNSGYQVVATVSGTEYRDKKVSSVGKTYYYQIRAIKTSENGKNYGSYSDVATLSTGYRIMGASTVNAAQMAAYYRSSGKKFPSDIYASKGASNIDKFCKIVVEEATAEGVRAEVLFAQICLETGFLQFGGDVKATQCNFGGLGATGGGVSGNTFPNVRTGIRAQVQHLKAYASTEPLKRNCVDNRFKYVARGCAPYVEWLGIPDNPTGKGWAAAKGYGYNLVRMIGLMKKY